MPDFLVFMDPSLGLKRGIADACGEQHTAGVPLVSQVGSTPIIGDEFVIVRDPIVLTYQILGWSGDSADPAPLDFGTEVDAFIAALHVGLALTNALSFEEASSLCIEHPGLDGVVVPRSAESDGVACGDA